MAEDKRLQAHHPSRHQKDVVAPGRTQLTRGAAR